MFGTSACTWASSLCTAHWKVCWWPTTPSASVDALRNLQRATSSWKTTTCLLWWNRHKNELGSWMCWRRGLVLCSAPKSGGAYRFDFITQVSGREPCLQTTAIVPKPRDNVRSHTFKNEVSHAGSVNALGKSQLRVQMHSLSVTSCMAWLFQCQRSMLDRCLEFGWENFQRPSLKASN